MATKYLIRRVKKEEVGVGAIGAGTAHPTTTASLPSVPLPLRPIESTKDKKKKKTVLIRRVDLTWTQNP